MGGIALKTSTVDSCRIRLRNSPAPTWRACLMNHGKGVVSIYLNGGLGAQAARLHYVEDVKTTSLGPSSLAGRPPATRPRPALPIVNDCFIGLWPIYHFTGLLRANVCATETKELNLRAVYLTYPSH